MNTIFSNISAYFTGATKATSIAQELKLHFTQDFADISLTPESVDSVDVECIFTNLSTEVSLPDDFMEKAEARGKRVKELLEELDDMGIMVEDLPGIDRKIVQWTAAVRATLV
ncbi:hypothetical protein EXIGLDRAFT_763870 [Exidia glandulosa HHB12029]|uniref:Uncharacterized protein n=1 Tax=Exidia glandulosa HHB12029 TaxID=1314781 RepID=A0A165LL78_EXIGL|nr:hypothetical protein EXIGLDRAFT_763870 [Exidia glandulosa HHB12029]